MKLCRRLTRRPTRHWSMQRTDRHRRVLDSATQDANSIRLSAITYTDDMMANIGAVVAQTLEDAGGKYKGFIEISSELS